MFTIVFYSAFDIVIKYKDKFLCIYLLIITVTWVIN